MGKKTPPNSSEVLMKSMLIGSPLLKIMIKLAERIPMLLKHAMVRPRMISAARVLAPQAPIFELIYRVMQTEIAICLV